MKNKMKLWRKEARKHNMAEGSKHNGRKHKLTTDMRRTMGMSMLLQGLFIKAGLSTKQEDRNVSV